MRFRSGMTCCNAQRARVGLCCEMDRQLECASIELQRLTRRAPNRVPALLAAMLPMFPADMVRESSRQAGQLDTLVDCAAVYCAAMPTRTERRSFWALLAGWLDADGQVVAIHVTPTQASRFERLLGEQWARLRRSQDSKPK